jgi:hypothetical protein
MMGPLMTRSWLRNAGPRKGRELNTSGVQFLQSLDSNAVQYPLGVYAVDLGGQNAPRSFRTTSLCRYLFPPCRRILDVCRYWLDDCSFPLAAIPASSACWHSRQAKWNAWAAFSASIAALAQAITVQLK